MNEKISQQLERIERALFEIKSNVGDVSVLWLIFFSTCGSCVYLKSIDKKTQVTNDKLRLTVEGQYRTLQRIVEIDSMLQVSKR